MFIKKLKLTNFRNHKSISCDFDPGITLIMGPNGSGKSNLLEAVYLLATGSSQKSTYDKDLITYEHKYCTVRAEVSSTQGDNDLEVQILSHPERGANVSSKKVKVNKVAKTITHMTGIFNAVIFSPADLEIIIGSPSLRRKFMDNILIQTDYGYKKALSTYTKALRQRNKILEMINEFGKGQEQLGYWTQKILDAGSLIQNKRKEMFTALSPTCSELTRHLDKNTSGVEIIYDINEISQSRLEKHYEHEIASKTTLVGPHRDNFSINYNGHDLAQFGSRGQQRTILLAVKLAEVNYFKDKTGERPVVLLDDIFSELDETHRKAVMSTITHQQTIVTSAEDLDFIHGKSVSIIKLA